MKIEQIRYILEIYNSGSISKAAKKLYVSQPNVSSAVKKLEQELGFDIVIRTKNGITFTDKGIDLVRHGKFIIEQLEEITHLSSDEHKFRFSVSAPWYPPAEYAFNKLCLEYESKSNIDFLIRNANVHEAFDMLHEGSSNLAVIVTHNCKDFKFLAQLEQKKAKYHHLRTLHCNVNVAVNHPLIKEDHTIRFQKLWNYPYAKYPDSHLSQSSVTLPFINQNKIISSDSRENRSLIVSNSTAFSIGLPLPPKRIAELQWASFPIPDLTLDLGYVTSKTRPLDSISEKYLNFLFEELKFLDDLKV